MGCARVKLPPASRMRSIAETGIGPSFTAFAQGCGNPFQEAKTLDHGVDPALLLQMYVSADLAMGGDGQPS